MPTKRSHSTVRQEQSGRESSNVTDYFGSPNSKRLKTRDGPDKDSAGADRSIEVAGDEADATETRSKKRYQNTLTHDEAIHEDDQIQEQGLRSGNDDDDDDEDGPIGINFNEVISVSNEARLGQKTTGAKVHTNKGHAAISTVHSTRNMEARKKGSLQEIDARPSAMPLLQQASKRKRGDNGHQMRHDTSAYDIFDSSDSNLSDVADMTQRRRLGQQTLVAQALPDRAKAHHKQKQAEQDQQQHIIASSTTHGGAAKVGESNAQGNDEEAAHLTTEDSAFIEAPQPNTNAATVQVSVHSLNAIIKTLQHQAWTQKRNWDKGDNLTCNHRPAQKLWKLVERLIELLTKSADAQDKQHTDEAYAKTIDYLRVHDGEIRKLFASINREVDDIVSHKLAPHEGLAANAVKQRRLLLRSISRSLVPLFVFLIEQTCDLVPSEKSGSSTRLQFNAFTLQFFLRAVGWTVRLERSLDRGLKLWPYEREFRRNEEKLDREEATLKLSKSKARENFHKQLSALQSTAKRAELKLGDAMAQSTRKREELEAERRRMIQQREEWATKQREEELAAQRSAVQWEAFCRSTQALRDAPNPLKEKWDRAQRVSGQHNAYPSAPGSHHIFQSGHVFPHIDSEHDPYPLDDDEEEEDGTAAGIRSRNDLVSNRPGLQSGRVAQAKYGGNGQDWDKEEEQILCQALRNHNYDKAWVAQQLSRTESDVAQKAALFKSLYRQIYTERGTEIPDWAF